MAPPPPPLMGSTVRRLRRERGVAQAALAARAGISASYLNLIEHNRRPLTEAVRLALAEALAVDLHELAGGEEARIFAGLTEMFGDPMFRDAGLARDDLVALAGLPRGLGRAILDLHHAWRLARDETGALSERLADEALAAAPADELRGLVTSIRSFGEILHDHTDLPVDQRQRFLGILVRDSEHLTELLDRPPDGETGDDRRETPGAAAGPDLAGAWHLSDFLEVRNNFFPALEDAAEALRADALGDQAPRPDATLFDPLAGLLARRHGIAIQMVGGEAAPGARHHYSESGRRLLLSETLAPADRLFHVARRLAFATGGRILDRCLQEQPAPPADAHEACRAALGDYFARAVMMPYAPMHAAAVELRYDIERIGRRFGAGFAHVCHRLTTLRRPGLSGIPFHLIQVDIAGNVIRRFNGSGLRIARYGGVCPRWNVHGAFLAPGRVQCQPGETPDGLRWLSIARTIEESAPAPRGTRGYAAMAIGCAAEHAARMVYADGLDLAHADAITPIGTNCRLCGRADCGQRVFPALDIPSPAAGHYGEK